MTLWNDIRFAGRLLRRDRWLSVAAITALALGITVNTTIFTIVNAVMLTDLPISGVERALVLKTMNTTTRRGPAGLSYPEFEEWRRAARTFDGIAGHLEFDMTVADDQAPPVEYSGSFVSANTFGLIGVTPLLGRDFRAEDDQPGAAPVVILGHAAWTTRYAGDRSVIGRSVRVNGTPATVIGVMPERFGFPQVAGIWRPLGQLPEAMRSDRRNRAITGVGWMRDGVSFEQADADLANIAAALASQHPESNAGIGPSLTTFREETLSDRGRLMLTTLLVAVSFVLLIACANVANLLLARAVARAREMSVRVSIGASRWRIVRQLLVESLMLAAAAGAIGLALSVYGARLFAASLEGQGVPYWLDVTLDARVFAYTAALCAAAVLLFGLMPALQASSGSIAGVLNDAGRGHTASRRSRRLTGAFVVVQMALTLVLLTGAGLATHDLLAQVHADIGVSTRGLTIGEIQLPGATYRQQADRATFYDRLARELASIPGVRATFASAWPNGGGVTPEVEVDGEVAGPVGERRRATRLVVGPRYFDVIGTSIVRGRNFVDTDRGPVAIVNERFAELHFPGRDPIGRRVRLGGSPDAPADDWLTVIGVVRNVRQRVLEETASFDPVVYQPYARSPLPFTMVLARAAADTGTVAAMLRGRVSGIDRDLALSSVMALDDELSRDRWEIKFLTAAFGAFGVIALVLAIVGLNGVTAYAISQRTRELGIRIALGATARQIWWLVTRNASRQVLIGLAAGLPGMLLVGQVVQVAMVRVSGTDALTLIGVPLLLIAAALAACIAPARRATRLNAVAALRAD